MSSRLLHIFFFFQAEDGIRDIGVTGVQTCALPIFSHGFAEPLTTFPAWRATSTSSACRKASSCRWWSSCSATWGPGSMTSTPPPLRQSSPEPAQGVCRSGPARQDLDGLVLRLQAAPRSEEHTSELQSRQYLVCRLLLE